ncbi:hypothetical protein FMLHJGGC_00174 [Staphylococcus phage BSwM-KMM1]|nr:hypothetical protein FMLHJGGC_00174 [Pseudomonas phage BSwM KMM1]
MPVHGKRPNLFKNKNYKQVGRKTIDGMRSEVLDKLQATAQQVENTSIKRMPTYLQVTEKKLENDGVVDLKKRLLIHLKRKLVKMADGT